MNPDTPRPGHRPETKFTGDYQAFVGEFIDPNDPSLEPRERKGRPADRKDDGDKSDEPPTAR